jgi:hypothetical protein
MPYNTYMVCIVHVIFEITSSMMTDDYQNNADTWSLSSPEIAVSHLTRLFFTDLFPAGNSLEGLGRVAGAIHGTGQLRPVTEHRPSSAL